jgi:hypothetical protein
MKDFGLQLGKFFVYKEVIVLLFASDVAIGLEGLNPKSARRFCSWLGK